MTMNTSYAPSITSAQTRFLNGLLTEADEMLDRRQEITGADWPEARFAVRQLMLKVDDMTKTEASAAITEAIKNNKGLRDELAALAGQHGVEAPAQREYVTEVGIYRVGDRIFKVLPSRNDTGRYYAKELTGFHWEDKIPVPDAEDTNLKFRYAKGAMALITADHRMTPERERAFGRIVGACIDCGILLTDPKSIEYGKGPVCSDNYTN
jgi:hypothetical protein